MAREGRVSFNEGWRFLKGDAEGAQDQVFDDASWRTVRLPHDWAIEGPFDVKYNARCGGLPFHGIGWYRKHFGVPSGVDGNVAVEFDGAMNNSEVWINGHYLGSRPFGYMGFQFDLSDYLNYGGDNVIAVKLSPEDLSSRWYPGAGLYRNVWLEVKDPIHVGHWGTYITTPEVTDAQAVVVIESAVVNTGTQESPVTVETVILDADGEEMDRVDSEVNVESGQTTVVSQSLVVSAPHRWDIDDPYLYCAVTQLNQDTDVIDVYETSFGIRTIEFDAENGFVLNGRRVQLNGVCMHHDLGPLGAAVNRRATERQLQIMQEMGVNAIRTSHNPPSPEQLEFCDRLGLLCQVEAFDVWEMPKVPNGYNKYFAEWHERDLRDMIRRDRNHPCVIMWSIGNEILEQSRDDGWKITRHLTAICKDEDPTRPVTAGFNNYPKPYETGMAAEVDLVGMNYKPLGYAEIKAKHPEWILYGSETSSCTSSRGVYHLPIEKYNTHGSLQVTSYDLIAPSWAYPPDVEFDALEKNPPTLGEFVWTGFDYLGEPTPYGGRDNSTNGYWNGSWPARSSYFGTVDLCGFPKDRFYLYQSQWTTEPMIHVLPHWNWDGFDGSNIPVYCYTNCDEAELIVNGASMGKKTRGEETTTLLVEFNRYEGETFESKYRLRWDVPYRAGSIKVIGYRNGEVVCEKEIRTAGDPAHVRLLPDRESIQAGGYDLSFVTVRIEDESGTLCPGADHLVKFELEGPGEIAAVGNGNAATTEPFQANYRKVFGGLAMLIVRSKAGENGDIKVIARSDGLVDGEVNLVSQ